MTTPAREPDQHPPGEKPERSFEDVMWGRVERRRERIRAQVRTARAGDHKVPTWVLATVLALFLLGWLYLIFFG
ncbi:hypothetical protein GCM10020358_53260 [Amorphoplanes nipponensis]|uniref:Uncharacterized protein n=1 Tax=Actinoplanes nipponensis TaxID=135950 RepID=A0A919JQS1_9ACTN|nr:hypothetical protein [Actinoplanes nipponensis]GIE51234.1 hypothetical protein Ani05nite_47680 [Actinoplanes nipponensis]